MSVNGTVEFTRNPTLIDMLGDDGRMVRVSDIQKVPGQSLYYIKWLVGPFAGEGHTAAMSHSYGIPLPSLGIDLTSLLTFPSYEDAVKYEVMVLNALRLQGVRFTDGEEA